MAEQRPRGIAMRIIRHVALDPVQPLGQSLGAHMARLDQFGRQRLEQPDERRVGFVVAVIPHFENGPDRSRDTVDMSPPPHFTGRA